MAEFYDNFALFLMSGQHSERVGGMGRGLQWGRVGAGKNLQLRHAWSSHNG